MPVRGNTYRVLCQRVWQVFHAEARAMRLINTNERRFVMSLRLNLSFEATGASNPQPACNSCCYCWGSSSCCCRGNCCCCCCHDYCCRNAILFSVAASTFLGISLSFFSLFLLFCLLFLLPVAFPLPRTHTRPLASRRDSTAPRSHSQCTFWL